MNEHQESNRVVAKVPWWVARALADKTPLRSFMVVGGIGSGKSHGAQGWDIAKVIENGVPLSEAKPSRSWTVAPNYRICETLLDLTLQVAGDVFSMTEGVHYDIRRSFPRFLDFKRMGLNHQLVFLSADNPEHFVSTSITHWRWSEVGVSKALVFEKLQDRLRDKRAKCPQCMLDGSPEGINHWSDWAAFGGWERDAVDEKRNFRKFRLETGDNIKNLSPGYLEALRARYAYSKERLLSYEQGIFTNHFSNNAYFEFVESRNVVGPNEVEPSPSLPLYLSFDFNVSPLCWIAFQRYNFQKNYYSPREQKWIAIEEASGESRGLMDAVAEFGATFPVGTWRNTPIIVYGDASGYARNIHAEGDDYTAIEKYLTAIGYRNVTVSAARSNPTQKHRLEKVAALMAYEKFAVSSKCQQLLNSFLKTTLVEGTFDIHKPNGDTWTHWSDAIGYGLCQVAKDIDLANPNARRVIGAAL